MRFNSKNRVKLLSILLSAVLIPFNPITATPAKAAVSTNGLVAHFDAGNTSSYNGSGSTWSDLSANSKNVTLVGSPTFNTSGSKYFSFSGTGQYATFPSDATNFSSGFSMSFYANFGASKNSFERIIDFGNGANSNNIAVSRESTNNNIYIEIINGSTGQGRCQVDNGIVDNEWAHWSIVLDGTNCNFYKNGIVQQTTIWFRTGVTNGTVTHAYASVPATVNRTSNFIGKSNWSSDSLFEGGIAELAIYNRALSASEIIANYDAQALSLGSTTTDTITVTNNAAAANLNTLLTNDLVVSGYKSSDNLLVKVSRTAGNGLLKLSSTPAGVTGVNSQVLTTAASSLAFTATQANANLALANLQYAVTDSPSAQTTDTRIVVEVSFGGGDDATYIFNPDNGHFYKNVSTSITPDAARIAAEASSFVGISGYLTNITSANENTFVYTNSPDVNSFIIGGSDAVTEDVWKWLGGPESGKQFWAGSSGGSRYTSDGLNYANWNTGEPNSTNQDCAHIWGKTNVTSAQRSYWDDIDCGTTLPAYVIEYGGNTLASLPHSISRTLNVTINWPSLPAPTNLKAVTDSDTQITLTWSAPTPPDGETLTKYSIATSVDGGAYGADVDTADASTTAAITGLSANHLYSFKIKAKTATYTSVYSAVVSTNTYPLCVTATSTVVVNGVNKTVVQFKNAGTYCRWNAPASLATVSADYLVVGGGASSTRGYCSVYWGQGGGGGAVLSGSSNFSGTVTIKVGAGGASFTTDCNTNHTGSAGGASYLGSITANGGSGGTSGPSSVTGNAGRNGGVSGNNNLGGDTTAGTTVTSPACAAPGLCAAGGGGGARTAGSGVDGGDGVTSSITGTSYVYGAGGAGRSNNGYGTSTGGAGGNTNGANALANTGAGGSDAGSSIGAGGSGIIVISYVAAPTITSVSPTAGATLGGTITITGTNFTAGSTAKIGDTPLVGVTVVSSTSITASVPELAAATYAVSVTTAGGTATLNSAYLVRGAIDVNFTEVIFSYSGAGFGHVNKTVRGSVGDCTDADTDCIGKAEGDQVLFYNVTTRDGVAVDALVTTEVVSAGAVIKRYEVGAKAGGSDSYFQTDIRITTVGAYARFKIEFYAHGLYDATAPNNNRVTLQNVNATGIDIDYGQFNSFYKAESYTRSTDTRLTVSTIASRSATDSDFKFQGSTSIGSNAPQDQVILNYGDFNTMSYDLGSTKTDSTNNALFGIAFIALGWGTATPSTTGGVDYTLTYNGNGNTSGSVPASQTGKIGQNMTVAGNTGTLVRTGYTFNGWNTKADGTGTNYAVGSKYPMPRDGGTLYAKWTGTAYTLTYNANGGSGAPTSVSSTAGSSLTVSATIPTRAGYTFDGWYTTASGTGGTAYASSSPLTMPAGNLTLYAVWTQNSITLTYNENGGSSASLPNPASITQVAGSSVTLSSTVPTYTGFTFAGWNTAANGSGTTYAAGASLSMPATATTLYAKWTANVNYTLTYSANGGTGAPTSESHYSGEIFNLSATVPTRTGYTFANWNTQADGNGTNKNSSASFTMPNSATTLYAKWTVNSYTVTYNAGTAGGSGSGVSLPGGSPYTVNYGVTHTVQAPGATTTVVSSKTYTFAGWSNGSTIYKVGDPIVMGASNVTLTAQWIEAFDVKYIPNGGTPGTAQGDSECVTSGLCTDQQVIALDAGTKFTRTGYTFSKWVDQAGTELSAGSSNTITATNFIFTAKWVANDNSLIYNANGGSGAPATATVATDSTATVANSGASPTRNGYNFVAWNTAANGSGTTYAPSDTFIMPGGNVTLYAIWSPVQIYLIVYSANGGANAPVDGSYAENETATVEVQGSMTRAGYGFAGWNTSADGTGTSRAAAATFTMPNSNVYLYAQWSINAVTITYDGNGGTNNASNLSGNPGSSQTITSNDPTRTGYTFLGWNTAANGSGTSYANGATFTMPNSNTTMYAQWQALAYVLDYDANGGANAPANSSQNYGATVTAAAKGSMTRSGYTFLGWNTISGGTGTNYVAGSSTFAMPDSNVTLYAQWAPQSCTVIYNANGGTGAPNNRAALVDTTFTVSSTVPTRTGYTFAGWNEALDGTGTSRAGSSTFTMPSNNVTLFAQWTAITYTLTYDGNTNTGGSAPSSQTGSVNTVVTVSAAPGGLVKTGYYFAGWNTAADGSGSNYAAGSSYVFTAANATLYAIWIADNFPLTYNANGGSNPPGSESRTTGATAALSATTPTRPGYTFANWYTTASGSGGTAYAAGANFTMPGTATVLYAIWSYVNYTVTYDKNGGSGTEPAQLTGQHVGDSVTVDSPSQISKTNSNFVAWNTAADGSGTSYNETSTLIMPADNVTLYAIWSSSAYTLAYNANGGGNAPAPQSEIGGTTVSVANSTPTRSGFTFASWNVQPAGGGTTYNSGGTLTMPTADLVLYALWNANQSNTTGNVVSPPIWGGNQLGNPPTGSLVTVKLELDNFNTCELVSGAIPAGLTLNIVTCTVSGTPTQAGPYSFTLLAKNNTAQVQKLFIGEILIPTAKPKPTITWPTPSPIYEGTPLSGTQLNAKASVPGKYVYDYSSGKLLPNGKYQLKVRFIPDDSSLETLDATVELVVLKKEEPTPTPVIPSAPIAPTYQPVTATRSIVYWSPSSNAISYNVVIDGKTLCTEVKTINCVVNILIGPKTVVKVQANGKSSTKSALTPAAYKDPAKPIVLATVYFDTAKYNLKPTETKKLIKFANDVKRLGFTKVRLFGHTDSDQGIDNQILSNNRAKSVLNFVKKLLPKVKYSIGGFADKQPAASNKTAAGKADNRRTEATIY